jgi:hypothetical protein
MQVSAVLSNLNGEIKQRSDSREGRNKLSERTKVLDIHFPPPIS